jgi:protein involved in ribonucleotide reduction
MLQQYRSIFQPSKSFIIVLILLTVIGNSSFAQRALQTATERNFIPEGIVVDTLSGDIYISSINLHKIMRINNRGHATDFIAAGQDGFLEGLGMKIDYQRKYLWAASVLREGNRFTSKIHAFDLHSGKTIQQYQVKDTIPHLFNDLAVTDSQFIYITDTYSSAIYKIDPQAQIMSLFLQDRMLRYPNGIISAGNQLYVATYRNGLVKINLSDSKIKVVPGFKDSTIMLGLDGLALFDNCIYGVYNTGSPSEKNCLIKYTLSSDGDAITNEYIIESGKELINDPTTCSVYKGQLYLITNSYLDLFNKNKTSTTGIESELSPVNIRIYPLK